MFNRVCNMSFCFQGGKFDAKPFLLYYYYGGMVYTALKNYERALYFYEVVSLIHIIVTHLL